MNAERLLQHYEQISDAPDAIARLRRFILDLAVRGKLVPQDFEDESASELLKRIAEEKARLLKAGEIRTPKPLGAVVDVPFSIPSNWSWSQIAEIGIISPRNDAPDALETSFVPMPLIAAEYGVANRHEVRTWGEIKKGYTHFAEGDVGLAKITPCFENGKSTVFRNLTGGIGSGTTELHVVRPLLVVADYILLFWKSPHFIETGIPKMTGTAGQKRVPTDYFANSPFPLPPLAEQHRIVAKVDELMALCDALEVARTERETKRDRLAAASLARLNTPDPETFRDDARFSLDALPALTARPDQIKQLRQTILNLAVRGKLVPQDPTDEPAEELLKRIQRARIVEGKASGQVAIEYTNALSGPRPRGWVTTAVQHVSEVGTGSTPTSTDSSYYANGSIPWLTSSSSGLDEIASAENFVTEKAIGDFRLKVYPPGSLLVALYGQGKTRGQVAKLAINAAVNQACAVITWIEGFEDLRHFLFIVFKQQYHEMRLKAEGGAQPNLNLRKIKELRFDLPPLAEQHRIVTKVDELMALCDQLETSLTSADETRKKLLDALLAEALAPVNAEALHEAAE